ncbi:MAG: hypothetical protein K1060chlam2_01210 [Chlamydiae bacterium]|nr:hypothetical protein [Chlamydiota bacterium]
MIFPTIVSYYTKETAYEEHVKRLIASCEELGLHTSFDAIPNLGTWERNCCYKPKYILQKLTKLKRPLLWVDADAEIAEKPILFEDFPPDIALRIVEELPDDHPSKMISGTVYLNHTPAAFEILKLWDAECERLLRTEENVWDQVALRNVLLKSQAEIYPLPKAYYMVYDKREEGEEAFIIHYQASRTEKKVINQEVTPFWR